MTYILAALGGDDDLEEYRNLPAWRRDLFWNIKLSSDLWLAIPKPFELGVTATGAERLFDAGVMVAKDGEDAEEALAKSFHGFGGSMAHALMPVDGGTFLGPMKAEIEVMLNRSEFTGRPIIPFYEEGLPVDQRKGTQYASRLGLFGQWLTGADPRVVDHLIRGHLGTAGSLAMSAADLGRGDKTDTGRRLAFAASGVARSGEGPNQVGVQRFLEEEKEAGRPQGKPSRGLSEMKRSYYEATTGEERDAIAAQMRAYADGRDPVMVFNRMVSEGFKVLGDRAGLEGPALSAFDSANEDLVMRARALQRANAFVNKMIRAEATEAEVRQTVQEILDALAEEGDGADGKPPAVSRNRQ
jgi:hypothetical protein